MDKQNWIDLGVAALRGLARQEYAFVWHEAEARISDQIWHEIRSSVDPHHLSSAKRRMLEEGELVANSARTRGGKVIEVYSLSDGPKRRVESASARKRLLQSRYLGWATGTKRHPRGLLGGAGESATNESLRAAAASGYRLLQHEDGEVRKLFGEPVVGGPLDNAAHLIVEDEGGFPAQPVTVLVEVKNIRECVYPNTHEIYQLLEKAVRLQIRYPGQRFLPILVCRQAHVTTFYMAKQFGFHVVKTNRQFLKPTADVTEEMVAEVRTELGYYDLRTSSGPDERIVKQFERTVPKQAAQTSARWAQTADRTDPEMFKRLRNSAMDPHSRSQLMDSLREHVREVEGKLPSW